MKTQERTADLTKTELIDGVMGSKVSGGSDEYYCSKCTYDCHQECAYNCFYMCGGISA